MREFLRAICDVCEGISLAYIVLVAMFFAYLLFLLLNSNLLSARLIFFLRWFRFILEALFIYVAFGIVFRFGGSFSLGVLSVLLSAWLEFTYMWLKAHNYSKRNILPFSGYVECDNAWRPDRKYYKLKEEIQAKGFVSLKSFKARDYLGLATLFYNKKEDVALLVVFGLVGDNLGTFYYFMSKGESDKYLIFTNDFSQDVLFLKGKYSVHYRPLSGFKALYLAHKRRMPYVDDSYVDFEKESKNLPHLLYNDNLQEGLRINAYSKNRNEGQLLTQEGKFQFCKKLIIKNYFRI